MNYYKLNLDFDDMFYFLDLHYTTEEQGTTYHWFLCLNTGTKQQVSTKHLRLLQPIEYSNIDQSQITEIK